MKIGLRAPWGVRNVIKKLLPCNTDNNKDTLMCTCLRLMNLATLLQIAVLYSSAMELISIFGLLL